MEARQSLASLKQDGSTKSASAENKPGSVTVRRRLGRSQCLIGLQGQASTDGSSAAVPSVSTSSRYSAAIRLGRAASSAAERRGGDIGRSVKRMPVAWAIALAIAAIGGTIGISPTPRTP